MHALVCCLCPFCYNMYHCVSKVQYQFERQIIISMYYLALVSRVWFVKYMYSRTSFGWILNFLTRYGRKWGVALWAETSELAMLPNIIFENNFSWLKGGPLTVINMELVYFDNHNNSSTEAVPNDTTANGPTESTLLQCELGSESQRFDCHPDSQPTKER